MVSMSCARGSCQHPLPAECGDNTPERGPGHAAVHRHYDVVSSGRGTDRSHGKRGLAVDRRSTCLRVLPLKEGGWCGLPA